MGMVKFSQLTKDHLIISHDQLWVSDLEIKLNNFVVLPYNIETVHVKLANKDN